MRIRLLPIIGLLVLSACGAQSEEATIKEEIAKANYCETAADCEDAGGKCPFDCYIFVNKAEVGRIKTMVDGFQSQCVYSCIAINGVECVENTCQPIIGIPEEASDEELEGNVGASCTSHEECLTPMDYLIRSSCPFDSLCIEGKCSVVCPMAFNEQTPPSGGAQCATTNDCDCDSYAASDMKRCACVDSQCVAIVAE